ncbi:Inhibitory regulator protein IRA2 [Meyerozyma sp. JA9]|nr:Inhibitory regulator protein IRA2 [Meyerozyma sp. JA9]
MAFEKELVGAIAKRLASVLPNRTGYSVAEVEFNQQFIITKQLLLRNTEDQASKVIFIENIFERLCYILNGINEEAEYSRLRDRDGKSLASTLIVLRTLSEVIFSNWEYGTATINPTLYLTVLDERQVTRNKLYSHFVPPPPLNPTYVEYILETLTCLLSSRLVKTVSSLVRGSSDSRTSAISSLADPEVPELRSTDNNFTDDDIHACICHIDAYIESGLKYIAASNPEEYSLYIRKKLLRFVKNGELIPINSLQRYSPLLKFLFHRKGPDVSWASLVYTALPYIKSNTWRQVFIVFYASSIQDQSFSRPEDYLAIVQPGSGWEPVAKNLFDFVCSVFDEVSYSGVAATAKSWLSVLCLSDFIELEATSRLNKLKVSFNKRLKFLSGILKDIGNASNIESFQSAMNIFQLGARLKDYPDHPIYKFTSANLELVHANLQKLAEKMKSGEEARELQLDMLIVSFFISAILIDPSKYIELLVKRYHETNESIKDVRILVKVVKGLSAYSTTDEIFNGLMSRLASPLKGMIFTATEILKQTRSISDSSSKSSDISFKQVTTKRQTNTSGTDSPALSIHSAARSLEDSTKNSSSPSLHPVLSSFSSDSKISSKQKLLAVTEEVLSDLYTVFASAPHLYFKDSHLNSLTKVEDMDEMFLAYARRFVDESTSPIKFAMVFRGSHSTKMFDAACALSMTIFDPDNRINKPQNPVNSYVNYLTLFSIFSGVGDALLSFSLTDASFKQCFLFLDRFLHARITLSEKIPENTSVYEPSAHLVCRDAAHAFENVIFLALCAHDIQYYNIAKSLVEWYIGERENVHHFPVCLSESSISTFKELVDDDSVFTGFVSLHKRFRKILRNAKPTRALFFSWVNIFDRWKSMIESKANTNDDNTIFRHFTGFLSSTCGCFYQEDFTVEDSPYGSPQELINEFIDRCIMLLSSQDLVTRVVIKDTLSNESHSASFFLICKKIMDVCVEYADAKYIDEKSIMFMEQAVVIITSMVGIKNDGAFVVVAMLPNICELIIDFINLCENINDRLRLKLRFCKLATAIEVSNDRIGNRGAFKLRNFYAKNSCEWLEQAVFFEETTETEVIGMDSETVYMMTDLAVECSKCLALQLDKLILDVPDGTKDEDISKHKDLAFATYFALFYKILQKYTGTGSHNFKYKVQQVIDNVLKCISNILQYDTDIGMQFVLPLGFHENTKIRAIFLEVFSHILTTRKIQNSKEEFPEEVIEQIGELYPLAGAIAQVASSTEHNMLASSFFGVFGYTKKLDKLFQVLLDEEIKHVSRSSDIFRRNSTLTKFLLNFTKENGFGYLESTLKPFLTEIIENDVSFEIERNEYNDEDGKVFVTYFTKLVEAIVNSIDRAPKSFFFICSAIYQSVESRFEASALVAVGSFIFLRFFCPAIISPETFFEMEVNNPKIKRSLMQLVKVIQNMANGSLGKWQGLANCQDELENLNSQIQDFLRKVSGAHFDEYPFELETTKKPLTELRYLHKFFYVYFVDIKVRYVIKDVELPDESLHIKVQNFLVFDSVLQSLGQPKMLLSLRHTSTPFKVLDPNNVQNNEFNEFMGQMSINYSGIVLDTPIVHDSIFHDGTPAVVVNLSQLKAVDYDIRFLVYKLFETASHVWDSKFYLVFDFSEYTPMSGLAKTYLFMLKTYAPPQLTQNCSKVFYFNIPRRKIGDILSLVRKHRIEEAETATKIYTYSQSSPPEIVNNLCLRDSTVGISRDTRVSFKKVKAYNADTKTFTPVTLKLGRQWLQIVEDKIKPFAGKNNATEGYTPLDVVRLSNLVKCEISRFSGEANEFTFYVNDGSQQTFVSSERSEILRFIYFATSRLPKQINYSEDTESDYADSNLHWFGRLHNIVFHGLLSPVAEVRQSASLLFASLSTFYDLDYRMPGDHAKEIAFPSDTTDFIVSTSAYLARTEPTLSYKFFKAFFDYYEKLPEEHRLSAVMYISPWIDNVTDYIFLESVETGPARVADIVRNLCRISAMDKDNIACYNDYVWKKLCLETRILNILLDEVVAFAINNKNDGPNWSFIIGAISPSVEICGEVISRLLSCIAKTRSSDSEIASSSKVFEIKVLVKICASLFFNSYVLAEMYLADVIFFCTLFIDNPTLQLGEDLQRLVINAIYSFLKKPEVTPREKEIVSNTLTFFTSQRARMLFGMAREHNRTYSEIGQIFNRASSFEVLCDYLTELVQTLGDPASRTNWIAKWCSYAIDVAFMRASTFQTRAILLVGIVSKKGINDSTATRILKLISKHAVFSLDYLINTSTSIARIMSGVSPSSYLPSVMIWASLCSASMSYSAFYQPAIQTIVTIRKKLLPYGHEYLKKIFADRVILEPLLSTFEQDHDVTVTEHNYETYVFAILSQGLKLPHLRHTSIVCMREYSRLIKESVGSTSLIMRYLFFLYLSVSEPQFEAISNELGLRTSDRIRVREGSIPKLILDYFSERTSDSDLTIITACHFFKTESCDNVFRTRLLHLFDYLVVNDVDLLLFIYPLIKETLITIVLNNGSVESLTSASTVSMNMTSRKDYHIEDYAKRTNTLVRESGVRFIDDHELKPLSVESPDDLIPTEVLEQAQKIQEMVYRAACSYVEGQRLED